MQSKYKAKGARISRFFYVFLISFIIIALFMIAIYFIYEKFSDSDNIINDTENNISIENKDEINIADDKSDKDHIDNNSTNIGSTVDDTNNNQVDIESEKKEYIYGERVPESEPVLEEYFDDAVFIGNSQIEGISIYSTMKNASVLAGKGIMVDTIFTKEVVKTENGSRITIMDALAKEKFGKVYIMLGANELGWAYDYMFIEQYGKVIDEIKRLQPDAKIYVNAIMPVSKKKSDEDRVYNNTNIDNYNKLILNMTKEKEVYYLDSKEALADEEGNLPEDAGSDGVHFNATYYEKWFNYLLSHTVN